MMEATMNDRTQQLERAVRRWKLVSLALAILCASFLAIAGTFGLILILRAPEIQMLREEAMVARDEAERANAEFQAARQKLDAGRAKNQDGVDP
jgi:hypothetical protein